MYATNLEPKCIRSERSKVKKQYTAIPVDNFGTVVGENPTPYGILALWAVNSLSIVYWDVNLNFFLSTHEAFMIEMRCLEGTFGCKSYDLSDWYRLYIGCKKAGSTITNQNKGLLDRIRLVP